MTIKTEGVYAGEFLLSEANGSRSREEVVIAAGSGILKAGTLIALLTAANAGQAAADAGNTGNGVLNGISITSAATSGTYVVEVTSAPAGGAKFAVVDLAGKEVGQGVVGTQFVSPGLTFDLTEGATKFVKGDKFTLTVKANLGEYTAYDDDGTDDGRRAASGILYASVDATLNDVRAVGVMRDAEVIERLLTGLDANGRADLQAKSIVIRP
ncbi:head decoration protein [Ectopseudomonas khazarica]|uniref:head decoration protein n=1 Tax=Ectopseudomonas khazarica TaxID=2502979 RepID=UPI00106DEEF5|nr:head decoration protein [Pseudomonas khazarica]